MKRVTIYVLIICVTALSQLGELRAQKKSKSRLGIEYLKKSDGTQFLEISLIVKFDRYLPYPDGLISVYNMVDTTKVYLGDYTTNEDGIVMYQIEEGGNIIMDSSGYFSFSAQYLGNDSIKPSEKSIKFKRGNLDISFYQKDSVKSINVLASEIDASGNFSPMSGKDISFYVQGTFSLYKFAEEETGEKGNVSVNFPVDMPGDTAGVLNIVVKVEEDKKFGTIEALGQINWGTPIQPVLEKHRGLGDTDAPLWMVYTLITLLSAVWLHYLYVIFLIVKIKLTK